MTHRKSQAGILREAALTWFRLAMEARSDNERRECFRLAQLNALSARAAERHRRKGFTERTDARSIVNKQPLWDTYQKTLQALYHLPEAEDRSAEQTARADLAAVPRS